MRNLPNTGSSPTSPLMHTAYLRRGMTVIELAIYAVIFSIVLSMIVGVFFWMNKSQQGMRRLDIFHDLRSCSEAVADELSFATAVLYPPVDVASHHQLVFRSRSNEIVAIFLNERGQLTMLNYERRKAGKDDGSRIVARHAIEFSVKRRDAKYVAYRVRMRDELGFEFVLSNSILLHNTLE